MCCKACKAGPGRQVPDSGGALHKRFRDLSGRRIVAAAFAGAAALTAIIIAVIALAFSGAMNGGGTGVTTSVLWTALGLGVIGIFMVWLAADRLLVARRFDHRSLPARPEFYDFQDLEQPMHWDEMQGAMLKDLHFVVFDTETTGLFPSKGDEIISIAAVCVSGGEMDEARAYSRLVNPGMTIPPQSIRFHGITDDMVADEEAIGDVLPDFREFVGDGVLVAHNAAFDMKFLRLKEEASGIAFPNLVLDTLLLSVFLEHESHNHSLDAISERMGITVEGRHTALGDAVATAKVLLKMLDRLEARGLTTLRQVVDASAKIEHVRKMQERF